jgi:hypothetical protein
VKVFSPVFPKSVEIHIQEIDTLSAKVFYGPL